MRTGLLSALAVALALALTPHSAAAGDPPLCQLTDGETVLAVVQDDPASWTLHLRGSTYASADGFDLIQLSEDPFRSYVVDHTTITRDKQPIVATLIVDAEQRSATHIHARGWLVRQGKRTLQFSGRLVCDQLPEGADRR